MNVIFGATSVGKTALLRQVLACDDFYVLKFDLRISGFADLRSLYVSLCEQCQTFFDEMGDEEMDKQAITFKHMLLDLEEREAKGPEVKITVADIANLMETLQSCLLKYWEYDPKAKVEAKKEKNKGKEEEAVRGENKNQDDKSDGGMRKIDSEVKDNITDQASNETREGQNSQYNSQGNAKEHAKDADNDGKLFKKRPVVFFMDEAHKLPALVDDALSLKVLLDTLLVLTKQDRLCHVILATSDSFFQHFLRSMNVGHHSHILTIGDCTAAETQAYFEETLLPTVPDELKSKVDFPAIYDAFGGKLSHINDYLSAWIYSDATLKPLQSAIFTQAYTLLEFHLTHAQFETFSPLSTATSWSNTEEDKPEFSRDDLLYVMRALTKPPYSLPYFDLCRKVGTPQANAMIKTRILELRWTKTVSPEQEWVERKWSEDGIERPIVLPMTRIVRKAMEVALMEEDMRAEEEDKSQSEDKRIEEENKKESEGKKE